MISIKNVENYDQEMIQDIYENGNYGIISKIVEGIVTSASYITYEYDLKETEEKFNLDFIDENIDETIKDEKEELKYLFSSFLELLPSLSIAEYNKLVSDLRGIARENIEYKNICEYLISTIASQIKSFELINQDFLRFNVFKTDTHKGMFH